MADGRGRIQCAYCGADLGPGKDPNDTNVEDMCEACMKRGLAGKFPAIRTESASAAVSPAPPSPVVPIVDILRRLDDVERRMDDWEKWADRK